MPSATESAETDGKRVGSFVSDETSRRRRVFKSPYDHNRQWRAGSADGALATPIPAQADSSTDRNYPGPISFLALKTAGRSFSGYNELSTGR